MWQNKKSNEKNTIYFDDVSTTNNLGMFKPKMTKFGPPYKSWKLRLKTCGTLCVENAAHEPTKVKVILRVHFAKYPKSI